MIQHSCQRSSRWHLLDGCCGLRAHPARKIASVFVLFSCKLLFAFSHKYVILWLESFQVLPTYVYQQGFAANAKHLSCLFAFVCGWNVSTCLFKQGQQENGEEAAESSGFLILMKLFLNKFLPRKQAAGDGQAYVLCSFHLSQSLLFFSLLPPSFASFLSLCHYPPPPLPIFCFPSSFTTHPKPKDMLLQASDTTDDDVPSGWMNTFYTHDVRGHQEAIFTSNPPTFFPTSYLTPTLHIFLVNVLDKCILSGIVACKSYSSVLFVFFLLHKLVFEFLLAVKVKLCVNSTRRGQFYDLKQLTVYAQFF